MLSLSLHNCFQCPWQEAGKTGGNIPQGHGERGGMRERGDRTIETVQLYNKIIIHFVSP